MAYITGSADSLADLLNKIKNAAESVGWVTNRYTAGVEWFFRNADASSFFQMRIRQGADNNYANYDCMFITGAKGYDSSKDWANQPGSNLLQTLNSGPVTKFRPWLAGPFTRYHAFVGASYIHVAVEVMAGTYCYIMVGDLDKDETVYTGGQYVAGHFYNNDPSADLGTSSSQNGINSSYRMFPFDNAYPYYSNSFIHTGSIDDMGEDFWAVCSVPGSGDVQGRAITMGIGAQEHPNAGLLYASYNALNDSTMLVPATKFVFGSQGRLRYIGKMRDFAFCQITGMAPGDVLKFGDEEWIVFPPYRIGTNSYRTSVDQGYAFKKVT